MPQAKSYCERFGNVNLVIKLLLLLIVFILGVNTLEGHIYTAGKYSGWSTGDWLINYEGGFVRRGLFGQFAMAVSEATGIKIHLVVGNSKALFYYIFALASICIAWNRKLTWIELAFYLAPWGLMFHVADLLGSGRKEILFLAFFASYIAIDLLGVGYNKRHRAVFYWISFPLLVLCHEGLLFFLHYFLFYEFLRTKEENIVSAKDFNHFTFPYLATVALAVFLMIFFQGDRSTAQAICGSLSSKEYLNPSICSGAISSLDFFNHEMKLLDFQAYLLCFFLIFAPIYLYYIRNSAITRLSRSRSVFFWSMVPTAPLFIVAIDWGRWLSISAICCFLSLISTREWDSTRKKLGIVGCTTNAIVAIFMIFYVVGWGMPHFINHEPVLILATQPFVEWFDNFTLLEEILPKQQSL